MSFETKGQEFVAKAGAALTWIVMYAGAVLAIVYLLKACGPEPDNRCVCECNGATQPK